ncbi:MAG: phospho-sugar mutase [Myxococcales bacterium]|nr:phospho-sugar mutase [Myxococcales bacterium]MCB9643010.1 phospho-sugar mutase [Myxococcales bacterium]
MDLATMLEKARNGFAPIPLSDEQKSQALAHLERWLSEETFASYQPQLHYLIEKGAWSLLLDSFYQVIPFGTGGRRGAVGVGPNRMNPYTLATSVQGHVQYLRKIFGEETALRVVIAYDVRRFLDLRGLYDASQSNPVLGLSSRDLCDLAASIYAANGVEAFVLPPEDTTYISTPELSFLIRSYKAQGGLNVSASHNHPDDNGGKFYNQQGAQPIAPDDQEMSDLVEKVREVHTLPFAEGVQKGLIQFITDEKRQGYIDSNAALCTWTQEPKALVAYSPMNGVGSTSVTPVLEKAGYTVKMLASQVPFDGSFEHVRYRVPNPEVRTSMSDVVAFGKEVGADLVMASDPDADRIGLVAPNKEGEWRFFTGNEIGVLIAAQLLHTLQAQGTLPKSPIIVKTEVTTELLRRVTEKYNGRCIGHLLVGCKFIADVMHHLETEGTFLDVSGSLDDFVMGTEESHGVLISKDIRDKDAAGAALILADLASRMKAEGRTLVDAIEDIYQEHGYHSNGQVSMVMEGAIGLARIRNMQSALRQDPPKSIGGVAVTRFFDHWSEEGVFGSIRSTTDQSARNVLVFHLEGGTRVVLRPSGTEPKAKLYIEVVSEPAKDREDLYKKIAETEARAKQIGTVFAQEVLRKVGVELPDYALAIADIVSIDSKERFAKEVVGAWRERAQQSVANNQDSSELGTFLKEKLASLGRAPAMFVDGLHAYLKTLSAEGEKEEVLDKMRASLSAVNA